MAGGDRSTLRFSAVQELTLSILFDLLFLANSRREASASALLLCDLRSSISEPLLAALLVPLPAYFYSTLIFLRERDSASHHCTTNPSHVFLRPTRGRSRRLPSSRRRTREIPIPGSPPPRTQSFLLALTPRAPTGSLPIPESTAVAPPGPRPLLQSATTVAPLPR